VPFRNPVTVYDPWLPEELIRSHDCRPALLDEVLSTSKVVFVLASVDDDEPGIPGEARAGPAAIRLRLSPDEPRRGRRLSGARAADKNRGASKLPSTFFRKSPFLPATRSATLRATTCCSSAHRTGGMPEALHLIGRMTVADAELILRGLPPQLCRRADPAVASRLRSKASGLSRPS